MKEHKCSWKFRRAYANIPLPLRSDICCVINDEPMSWQVVKIEVDNNTKIGYKTVGQLVKLKII